MSDGKESMNKNCLKRYRANATQEEIAKAVGITKQQYSRIELGQQHGSLKVWKRLAAHFDTTIDALLENESSQGDGCVAGNDADVC